MSSFEEVSGNCMPSEVLALINDGAKAQGLHVLLAEVLGACKTIGQTLRSGGYSSEKVGTQNDFGDHQLDVDVKTDAVLFGCLKNSGKVHIASSEENPAEIACGGTGFSVAFDPLDGSSIVDANFAVGTILGVWPGNGLINRVGKDQCFSLICQYGPRITMALAFNGNSTVDGKPTCMELTCDDYAWFVTIPKFLIASKGKTFAPGNLRATADHPGYHALVMYWIENKYTLRYSGGLVPDVYHILIKGQGVLSNASSASAKAKLRLLYEAAPIALIVEAAGGSSCVCASEAAEAISPMSLLEVPITDLDKRVGVCYGSNEEVQRFISHIF